MADAKQRKTGSSTRPNLGRHESGCGICGHLQREEIENEFISWKSPAKIAADYKLRDRSTVYRHAHALDLFSRRSRNIRAALERIIEKVDTVEVNGGAVVQAIIAFAKINAAGKFVERNEMVRLGDLFERMSRPELEAYAREGAVPKWFKEEMGATQKHGPEANTNA
jgi:hypothetical protein